MQLKFIDDDVRFVNYSTPQRHDMQFCSMKYRLVAKKARDPHPLICGVGLRWILGGTRGIFMRH